MASSPIKEVMGRNRLSMNHRNDSRPHYVLTARKVSCRYISDIHKRPGAQQGRSIVFLFADHGFIQTRPVKTSFPFPGVPVENYDMARGCQSYGVSDCRKAVSDVVVGMDKVEERAERPFAL